MKLHIKRATATIIGFMVLVSASFSTYAQNYNHPGGTINTCSGTFYDTGGAAGEYTNNQNITTTFCSNAGNCVVLNFSSFNIENNFDFMYIYDGPTTGSPLIGTYTGTNSPGVVLSSTGCITVRFTSDGSVTRPGWAAAVSCQACGAPPPPPPPPPANDDCAGAFPVTVNPDFLCGSTTAGTVLNATASPQNTASCFGTENDDVWFSFVATSTTHSIDLLNVAGSTTDMYHSVWSGTCPTLTVVPGSCSDPNSSTVTGLTIGNTYFIRVNTWSSTAGATSTFDVCVGTPPPPPTNISCAIPDPICSGSPITFTAQANNTQADEVDPGNDYDCLISQPNPSWYYLEIAAGGNLVIDITAGSDVDYAIWGPFTDLTNAVANCNSYAVPEDCSFSASAIEQAVVNGVVAGQVYVLLVTNYANTVQTITVTDAPSNTATTDCTIVPMSVELTDFNGVNVDNEIVLSWTTASEQNNSHFVVERSVDASVWTAIAVENGAGTTTSMQQYTSLDRNPSVGDNYYRLKQFDFDGKMTISDIISVSSSSVNKVIVYPNPSNDRISVISNHEIIAISIVDIRGTVVYTGDFDKVNSTSIELSDLNSGLYYLQTQTTSGTTTERIVVQH